MLRKQDNKKTGKHLASKVLGGDESAAARLISMIENDEPGVYDELPELFAHSGHAHLIGITGPSGSGKSTIAGRLSSEMAKAGKKVAVIAIDPSYINRGGALLADRARVSAHGEKAGVYIRSMADRGHPGGICKAVAGAVYVLGALGKEVIIVESVGAGQSDRDIRLVADTVITVFTPDYGDSCQVLKAGLLEIGDIVVVNKCDHAGAEDAVNALSAFIKSRASDEWTVPVIPAEAVNGKGIDLLLNAIHLHSQFLGKGKEKKAGKNAELTLLLLKEEMWRLFEQKWKDKPEVVRVLKDAGNAKIDPYSAVQKIMKIMD